FLEAEAGRAGTGFRFEAQRAYRERARHHLVPAVREQDRDHRGGSYLRVAHTATFLRSSGWAARRISSAISAWPPASASDSGVPPHRWAGRGLAPAASR